MFVSLGCRSTTSLQCEREMALLRSEILDLEDKYYALLAQSQNGAPATAVVAASSQWPVTASGDVIYEDQMVGGQVINGQIINGQIYNGQIIESPIYDNGVILPGTEIIDSGAIGSGVMTNPTMMSPTMANPTVAPTGSGPNLELRPESADGFELDLNDGPAIETVPPNTENGDQARNVFDGPEWEIGYENSSAAFASLDRIEIVSSQTRGKDLDRKAGDDGVEVMVQTLDIDNNFVEAEGELTVTVVDRTVGQIGKWTFLPKELKLFLSRDEFDNLGILLNLPWADAIPVSPVVDVQISMVVGGVRYSDSKRVRIQTAEPLIENEAASSWSKQERRQLKGAVSRESVSDPDSKRRSTSIERPKWRPVR